MLRIQTAEAAMSLGVCTSAVSEMSHRLKFACAKDERGRLWWDAKLIAEACAIRAVERVGVAKAIEIAAKRPW